MWKGEFLSASVWVAAGGAIGSVARYWIAVWAAPWSQRLPWGTIGINVVGSCIIGFVATLTLPGGRVPAADWVRPFMMVGVCGGFTTFSSFSLQTLELLRVGAWERALMNVGASVLLCLGSVWLGHAAALLGQRDPG